MLAALDNNFNAGRQQKQTVTRANKTSGLKIKSHFRIAYRKPSKKFIARKFYEKKTYSYMKNIMEKAVTRAVENNKCMVPTKRKVMAPDERLTRAELIVNSLKHARFK